MRLAGAGRRVAAPAARPGRGGRRDAVGGARGGRTGRGHARVRRLHGLARGGAHAGGRDRGVGDVGPPRALRRRPRRRRPGLRVRHGDRPEGGRAPDGATELAELRRRFGHWHAPIPALLDAVDPETVLRHDVHALSAVPAALHRGTTVLVGDAAHALEPNLGQGAGLALEDAVVLAHVLAGGAPVEPALARYTASRRPRAARLHATSGRLGRLTQHTGPVAARVRDAAVRLTPAALALRGTDATMGWRPPTSSRARAAGAPASAAAPGSAR
ncbi:FAD-dependent monooxygenase [Cellulomonas sp. JZ18]|uniref:FAD-dependent monooxygenase n=1 Tax=Cellulomonas sp. JZ18 TaxID=2654191 RepID=UPI00351AE4DC